MGQIKSFKDLKIWQKSSDLAVLVYKTTENFPKSELYGITNQIRRSVVSISSNIAEGFKRNHQKEKIQFYNIANASISELESQIDISYRLKFIDYDVYQKLCEYITEIGKMSCGLMKSTTNNSFKLSVLTSIFCFLFLSSIFYILNPHLAFASQKNGKIDPSYTYAWGENLGWLNFRCDTCNVHIRDTYLSGYVWSKQYGWINLSPDNGGVTNNCLGQLGGYAWSSNLGWINLTGASIDFTGKFTGTAGVSGTQTGRISFNCDNCDVRTDWRQCALRPNPPQVIINAITDNTVPSIVANITMTNEGTVGAEYQYEWCVVTTEANECGGGDDIFYSLAAKYLNPGEDFTTNLNADVPNPGNYYFKLVAHWEEDRSLAATTFTAVSPASGGGGGGGYFPPVVIGSCNGADFNHDGYVNSIDFSIMLFYWKTNPPFKNVCVDINKDNRVDSIDFSIMLAEWGKR